jgi:hypothetical protein
MFTVGQKVQARFEGNHEFYSGEIEKDNADGTFRIVYDDGDNEPSVKSNLIVCLQPGDIVAARHGGKGQWFKGKIEKVNGDATFAIIYDDGDKEPAVKVNLVSPVATASALESGTAVEAVFGGKGKKWFRAKVDKKNDDGKTVSLLYDDGDKEAAASIIRTIETIGTTTTSNTSNTASSAFTAGQKVEARFAGKAKFYGGIIEAANSDGSYAVRYDDGDREAAVKLDYIRYVASPGDTNQQIQPGQQEPQQQPQQRLEDSLECKKRPCLLSLVDC